MSQTVGHSIVTVGICPCWDRTVYVDGIDWGEHKVIASETCIPAGKALNISRALGGLGITTTAAGLWGQSDYSRMIESLSLECPNIGLHFTVVPGHTRTNVTLVDRQNKRELHLRAVCPLVSEDSLSKLQNDIGSLAGAGAAVFSGSMPDTFLPQIISIMHVFRQGGTRLIVDTSGRALEAIVNHGNVSLIKPNLEELCQLLGRNINNDAESIVKAARPLCDKVSLILVSRGVDGALLITQDKAIECRVKDSRPVVHTVGCGDYLLAGFLSQLDCGSDQKSLSTAVAVAAARAWGLTQTAGWNKIVESIEIEVRKM